MLGAGGGIQHAQHAPDPADIRHAQSARVSDLEIALEHPAAEGAYHLDKGGLRPSGRQVTLDAHYLVSREKTGPQLRGGDTEKASERLWRVIRRSGSGRPVSV